MQPLAAIAEKTGIAESIISLSPARLRPGPRWRRPLRLAKSIRSGQVFVNNYGAAGRIELPFGGVGRSGHGREKGFEGLKSYTRLKTVAIRHE